MGSLESDFPITVELIAVTGLLKEFRKGWKRLDHAARGQRSHLRNEPKGKMCVGGRGKISDSQCSVVKVWRDGRQGASHGQPTDLREILAIEGGGGGLNISRKQIRENIHWNMEMEQPTEV